MCADVVPKGTAAEAAGQYHVSKPFHDKSLLPEIFTKCFQVQLSALDRFIFLFMWWNHIWTLVRYISSKNSIYPIYCHLRETFFFPFLKADSTYNSLQSNMARRHLIY